MKETDVLKGNERFVQETKKEQPNFFEKLTEGQSPEYFVLACCDSRVSPSTVTQAPPGSIFVHRNIANQVVQEDESFSSSLYYALKHLKVKKIIIKGHTYCGGVAAAWEGNDEEELKNWLSSVKESLPDKQVQPDAEMEALVKANVQKQVERLKSHPVYQAYGEGVEVIGTLYRIENGKLEIIES